MANTGQKDQKEFSEMFDQMPKFLRFGPWSPTAYIFLVAMVCGMIHYWPVAMEASPEFDEMSLSNETSLWNGTWRFLFFLYGFTLVAFMCWTFAVWPLLCFTMMSWNLVTIRYLVTALLHFGYSSYGLFMFSEFLRFPSLVCNSITISVYWLVIFPSVALFIPSDKDRETFYAFNKSAFLLNVHLLNLPFAALDHLMSPRMLSFWDLYMGILVGVIYVVIYLFIMDPLGFHFYHVILSPRPHWCFLCYGAALSLFPLFIWKWNWAVNWFGFQ